MSGASTPKRIGRGYPRDLEAGPFQPMIDSWDLHLRAERKSAKTIRTYLEAAPYTPRTPSSISDTCGIGKSAACSLVEWITDVGNASAQAFYEALGATPCRRRSSTAQRPCPVALDIPVSITPFRGRAAPIDYARLIDALAADTGTRRSSSYGCSPMAAAVIPPCAHGLLRWSHDSHAPPGRRRR